MIETILLWSIAVAYVFTGPAIYLYMIYQLKKENDTAIQCPRCYRMVTGSCGPNCAWRRTESGEDELKRLRKEADEKDFRDSLKNRDGL